MTWTKALPVLAVCLIFDVVRFLFEQFWFFGPALAGVYCTVESTGVVTKLTAGVLGGKTAVAFCAAASGVLGYFGAPAIETFGVVMAIAVGFLGWLAVGLARRYRRQLGDTLRDRIAAVIGDTLDEKVAVSG